MCPNPIYGNTYVPKKRSMAGPVACKLLWVCMGCLWLPFNSFGFPEAPFGMPLALFGCLGLPRGDFLDLLSFSEQVCPKYHACQQNRPRVLGGKGLPKPQWATAATVGPGAVRGHGERGRPNRSGPPPPPAWGLGLSAETPSKIKKL